LPPNMYFFYGPPPWPMPHSFLPHTRFPSDPLPWRCARSVTLFFPFISIFSRTLTVREALCPPQIVTLRSGPIVQPVPSDIHTAARLFNNLCLFPTPPPAAPGKRPHVAGFSVNFLFPSVPAFFFPSALLPIVPFPAKFYFLRASYRDSFFFIYYSFPPPPPLAPRGRPLCRVQGRSVDSRGQP